ncbi:TetR/AcrR family transcriptional regulator [Nocardia crassostreae]|uniref:TetR/AcrR family transcriptional regulator n=1 Tax=Nocardia crassostreae TaxID=53428 RepID=UPI000835FAFF|nr:TetR/AcrR family transcriptional regulator [Nocardia crassostreae]
MSAPKPRRSPKSSDRQRDPERTRALILQAALAEFGAHGYAGARVGAIAERAGVNVQLISYYFDGKEGLYQSVSEQWQQRRREVASPGTPLPEQLRRYVLEAAHDPAGARLLAWSGLQYTGPADDPDQAARATMLAESVEEIRALRDAGHLPTDLDPPTLLVMLMAAAMAPITLPHVIAGVTGQDPHSPEYLTRFADQIALLARHLGLEPS